MANKKDPELELQRKTQIMISTFKLLAQKSHEEVTLAEVAKYTELSPSLISYYFKNKENLILETTRFVSGIRKESLLAMAALPISSKEKLEKLMEITLSSSEEVSMVVNFCAQLWVYGKKSPLIAKAFNDLMREQQDIVEKVVQKMIENNYIKKGNHKAKALLINALLDGFGIHLALKPELSNNKIHQLFYAVINKVIREDL